jgi:hypothetical protein
MQNHFAHVLRFISVSNILLFLHLTSMMGILSTLGCTSAGLNTQNKPSTHPFLSLVQSDPHQIWSSTLDMNQKEAIHHFNARTKLKNGMIYGDSVRKLDIRNKCAAELNALLRHMNCEFQQDVLKEPSSRQPIYTREGKSIPMHVYLCPDGGAVRIKPSGDPTSRYRPQPQASKALRYPYNSSFKSFDDEMVKVDHMGNPIPKWGKDLNLDAVSKDQKSLFLEDWANDAHADLNLRCDVNLESKSAQE